MSDGLGENEGIEPRFDLPSEEAHRLADLTAYMPEDVERTLERLAYRAFSPKAASAFVLWAHRERLAPDRMETIAHGLLPGGPTA